MITDRPATPADADLLLAWRNDPGTVRWSVVSESVHAKEHARWFAGVLADPTRRVAIVDYLKLLGPIGTYRLDGVGGLEVEVSVTIAPKYRGWRLATPLIELASRRAVEAGADVVRAVIHDDNEPSRRAFRNAGFEFVRPVGGGWFGEYAVGWCDVVGRVCPLCRRGVPHHTNSSYSIAGGDRHEVWDIHAVDDPGGVGLQECLAGDVLLARERAKRGTGAGMTRVRERECGGSIPPASTNAQTSAEILRGHKPERGES